MYVPGIFGQVGPRSTKESATRQSKIAAYAAETVLSLRRGVAVLPRTGCSYQVAQSRSSSRGKLDEVKPPSGAG